MKSGCGIRQEYVLRIHLIFKITPLTVLSRLIFLYRKEERVGAEYVGTRRGNGGGSR